MRSLISFSIAETASSPVLLIGLVLGLCVGACQRTHAQVESLERFVYRQGHMGMEVRLVLYAPDRESSVQAAEAAFAEVAMLDSLLSSYRSDSELMRVNRRAGEGPVAVGYHMFSILDRGQVFARRSPRRGTVCSTSRSTERDIRTSSIQRRDGGLPSSLPRRSWLLPASPQMHWRRRLAFLASRKGRNSHIRIILGPQCTPQRQTRRSFSSVHDRPCSRSLIQIVRPFD